MDEKLFYRVDDVVDMMQVSKDMAYKIIRDLNAELREKGIITVKGRVNARYLKSRVGYATE